MHQSIWLNASDKLRKLIAVPLWMDMTPRRGFQTAYTVQTLLQPPPGFSMTKLCDLLYEKVPGLQDECWEYDIVDLAEQAGRVGAMIAKAGIVLE